MAQIAILVDKIASGQGSFFRELYGRDEARIQGNVQAYLTLLRTGASCIGHNDVELFSSPGRTEIAGNHTDHNNGRVLAGAVDLDTIAVAGQNGSTRIGVWSLGYPDTSIDLSDLAPISSERYSSAALVRGMCAGIEKQGGKIGGFDAWIDGRVPSGSGLSSSASFELLIGAVLNELFNGGAIDPVQMAKIGQSAENNYFGKACGLMDQTTCAVGGLVAIDFAQPGNPEIRKLSFDFARTGFSIVITDTGGSHADLTEEYDSVGREMKAAAARMGASVLRELSLPEWVQSIPGIRADVGDRALLRSFHFLRENERVLDQVGALEKNDFHSFLHYVIDSGHSSYMYNQNIFNCHDVRNQGVSLGLALSDMVLNGKGAWRVHGGGFAGTIQAFVPGELLDQYTSTLEQVFGKGACHILNIREKGAVKLVL